MTLNVWSGFAWAAAIRLAGTSAELLSPPLELSPAAGATNAATRANVATRPRVPLPHSALERDSPPRAPVPHSALERTAPRAPPVSLDIPSPFRARARAAVTP